jgi:hypothetical protein
MKNNNIQEDEGAANSIGDSSPSNTNSVIAQPENLLFKKPLRRIVPKKENK